jgi:putative flippase GtrA
MCILWNKGWTFSRDRSDRSGLLAHLFGRFTFLVGVQNILGFLGEGCCHAWNLCSLQRATADLYSLAANYLFFHHHGTMLLLGIRLPLGPQCKAYVSA